MDAAADHAVMPRDEPSPERGPEPARALPRPGAWHAILAVAAALGVAVAVWFAAEVLYFLVDGEATLQFERHPWLDVALAGALVCAFAATLAALAPIPLWALALAGAAVAIPLLGPGDLRLQGLGAAAAAAAVVAAIGVRRPQQAPAVPPILAGGAALLVLVPVVALGGYEPPPAERHHLARPPVAAPAPAPAPKATARPKPKPKRSGTPRRAAAPLTPLPVAPAPVAADPGAERFLRAYYAELRREDFRAAWARLAPSVRASFGGFETWSAGFATTVSQRLTDVDATTNAETATVRLTLRATDRDACGRAMSRRFAQSWTLARSGGGWRATAVTAEQLSGGTVATSEPCRPA